MYTKNREGGFNHIKVAIIAIVVLTVILGGGLIVRAVNNNAAEASAAKDAVIPVRSQTIGEQSSQVTDFVQRFYLQYTATPDAGSTQGEVAQRAINGYGSGHAIDTFIAHERVCTQKMPTSVGIDGVASLGSPYKVTVTYNYENAASQTFTISVLDDKSALEIDDITCS